ncbi:SWPV1-294 [Shearwaterpox virus]|uniref:SWPV1-294 n=1 Tax=Shearwaterpox virus TaxID=1974596 RepID=A0A1V0S8A2_CNPV|nr:SWPV1-294 [Shearwaterpox virus]
MSLESLYVSMYIGTDEETINEINLYELPNNKKCYGNNSHSIKEVIQWLKNLNFRYNTSNVIYFFFKPLQQAIEARRLSLLNILIKERFMDVTYIDKYTECTTLHILTAVPDVEYLIMFLNYSSIDITSIKKYVSRANEMLLCKSVYVAIVKEILKGNKILSDTDLINLEEKITNDELEIAKMLIHKGVNINLRDVNGYTALRNSIINRNVKLIKFLLDNNADSRMTYLNSTVFELSVISKRLDIVNLITETCGYNKNSNILYRAVINNNPSMVKLLLDLGLNVNSKTVSKKTPIYNSISTGNIYITKILIDHGADLNIMDNLGNTPLMVSLPYPDIVKLLLENGADTSIMNKHKETVLNKAFIKCYSKVMPMIISYTVLQIHKQGVKDEGNEINNEIMKKNKDLYDIKLECEKEITDLKAIKLNSKYSLDIFLVSDNIQLLAKLVTNDKIAQVNTLSFKNYGNILEKSINKSLKKRKEFEKYFLKINSILTDNKHWYFLPYEIKYNIAQLVYL